MRERTHHPDKRKYGTPQPFFDRLNSVFGPFTLDPCASEATAKCDMYYDENMDGLTFDWAPHIVFMNPPFGRFEAKCKKNCKKKSCKERGHHLEKDIPGTDEWVRKAWTESMKGAVVVGIVPVSASSEWWHNYVMRAEKLIFVEGRVKYMWEGEEIGSPDFDTAVAVWTPSGNQSGFPELLTMKAYL